jgi:phage shock protein PspC (stress-responsive transcriptional regulator)/membrane protein implicated in regulation of membrane protease activity
LKEYLETIHRYFSSYDDSSEIIADIENRIAEIFLSKLKDGVQVITIEDVEALMATMGGIKDFKEIEVEEEPEPESQESYSEGSKTYEQSETKRLYRDEKSKILGGVLSGIAHYFSIDSLWTRLIFIVLFFGVWFFPSIPALMAIAYIVLWIILPGTYELKDQKKVKKMFRDPDDKVFGGVSSGIAAYFGIDVIIVRLLFVVLALFGGSGLILYIILWIILPEARTITDKMEMQGEPVTLKNIETNIKKSLKVEEGEESVWMKILLFPFRLIATFVTFLSKALGPIAIFLIEAIRVIFGVLLVIIAISMTLALLITGGAALGIFTGTYFVDYVDFPLELIRQDFPVLPLIAGFFAWLIPQIFLVILGVSVITKKLILNAKIGWSMFAIWLISIVVMVLTIPPIIGRYSRDGVHTEVKRYDLAGKTAVLNLEQIGLEDYDGTTLKLRGHEDSVYRLEQRFEARGKSRRDAIDNAKMVTYNVVLDDSVFTFDSNIQFSDEAKFRGQKLDMILYIPYNQTFMMDEDLQYILRSTIYSNGYRVSQMEGNTWMFTDDGLQCLTCTSEKSSSRRSRSYESDNGDHLSFDFQGFQSVDVGSIFNTEILAGSDWDVVVSGRDRDLEDVVVKVTNGELNINFKKDISKWDRNRKEVKVHIIMPELESLDLSGAAKGKISGFDQHHMEVNLSGASVTEMDVNLTEANIKLAGVSRLNLSGNGESLEATVSGASNLDAEDFMVDYANVNVSGASKARVHVNKELEIDASGGSSVRYSGDPMIKSDRSSGSSIIKE